MRHNRKLLATLLLSAMLFALCAFAFAGCCRHNKNGYEKVEPTCTEDGYVKIWCDKCNYVHDDNCEILPKKGHSFDEDGYCTVCGEPDLSNPAFGSEDDGLGLKLTVDGVLNWNRISSASKYELSILYSGDTEATVYTLDKKTASVKLDDLDKQNPGSSYSVARDGKYNLIYKGEDTDDLVLAAPAYGDTVKIYFGNKVTGDCEDYKRYSQYYYLTETDYGWQILADETKNEMSYGSGTEWLPYQICGKRVISYSFDNVNAAVLCIPQEIKQLNISFNNCARLTDIYIYSPQTYIGEAAFAGASDNLVIHCNFSKYKATNFDEDWNAKQPHNIYAGNFTVKYTDSY